MLGFRYLRKLLSLILPHFVKDVVKDVYSFIVLNIFLTYLLIFAILNNIVLHIVKKNRNYYFRDTRSSLTKILPKKFTSIIKKHSTNLFLVGKNTSSKELELKILSPIDDDVANNIIYDHFITDVEEIKFEKEEFLIENERDENDKTIFKNTYENLDTYDKKLICDLNYYFQKYNIDVETIELETEDGFIIEMWHMVPKSNSDFKKNGHPVLLLHGLLQSGGSFASSSKKSLAYFLCKNGYDVWFGNNRCGFDPKYNIEKVKLKSKNPSNPDLWDWDLTEMIKYDVRAMVEKVLKETNYQKLTLIGHSQGTAQSIYGLINGGDIYDDNFRLVDKIENFVALAPAIYPGPLLDDKIFVKLLKNYIDSDLCFGTKSFLPIMMFVRNYFPKKIFTNLCYLMFNYLFDWNDKLWNNQIRDRHFMFSPVYVSVKLMKWWLSPNLNGKSFIKNSDLMFPDTKTWFPVENAKRKNSKRIIFNHSNAPKTSINEYPNLLFFIPKQDRLVDGERLINHLINYEDHRLFKIWYIDEYSHMDVLWANDMIERIAKPLIGNLREPKRNEHTLIESLSVSHFMGRLGDNADTEFEVQDTDMESIINEEIITIKSPKVDETIAKPKISDLRKGFNINIDKSETEMEETENEIENENDQINENKNNKHNQVQSEVQSEEQIDIQEEEDLVVEFSDKNNLEDATIKEVDKLIKETEEHLKELENEEEENSKNERNMDIQGTALAYSI